MCDQQINSGVKNVNSPGYCSEHTCPFAFTDESEQVQNYGCLPTPGEIIAMRTKLGKTWACHTDPSKPCIGALRYLNDNRLGNEVVDKQLVTLDVDWAHYI